MPARVFDTSMKFFDPFERFEKAIKEGRLSDNESDTNYAGQYMYMGTDVHGTDLFKHIDTRQYLP